MMDSCKICGRKEYLGEDGLCWSCRERKKMLEIEDRNKEALKEGREFNTWSDKYLICPYCGSVNPLDPVEPELFEEGHTTYECQDCEKTFKVHVEVETSWETEKIQEEE